MTYGKAAVCWEERINFERMRKEKTERAQKALKQHGLGGVLTLDPANTAYVTMPYGGLIPATRYAFLPENSEPILFECGMWEPYTKETCPWLTVDYMIPAVGIYSHVRPESARKWQLEKFASKLKHHLKNLHLTSETIGLDTNDTAVIAALDHEGIRISPQGSNALMEAREIKTRDEVECVRMCASIVDGCFQRMSEVLRPGVTETEIVAEVTRKAYMLGAQIAPPPCVCSGPRTSPKVGSYTDRIIRPGELVYADLHSFSYQGYLSCYYRTFSVGRPTQAQKDAYQKTKDYLYDAIGAISPGATTKDIAEKFPRAEDFGRPDEESAILTNIGHGIGLTLHETPFITRAWSLDFPYTIKAGMTIAMETCWFTDEISPAYPRGQGTRIEEMVHVTDSGCEVLSKWPVDEITVVNI